MRFIHGLILTGMVVLSGMVSAQLGDELLPCPSDGIVCQLPSTWTREQLEAKIGKLAAGQSGLVSQGNELTFVYRISSTMFDRVSALFTFLITDPLEMENVPDSDLWVMKLKLQFDHYDESILSFSIVEHGERGERFRFAVTTWRGENAPPPPGVNHPLLGNLNVISYQSEALRENRDVYIYLPPNFDPEQTAYPVIYMTDGETMPGYAPLVDYLIAEGDVPPLVMIGTASADPINNENRRGDEYIPGRNAERFERHERFFTEEGRERATTLLNVSTRREDNIIFGFSNGGVFAIAMSVRHPDLYGTILPFSAGASAGEGHIPVTKDSILLPLKVYATAGTLEPGFHSNTKSAIEAYAAAGANAVFVEQVAGHDNAMWEVEFVNALKWAFKEQGKED